MPDLDVIEFVNETVNDATPLNTMFSRVKALIENLGVDNFAAALQQSVPSTGDVKMTTRGPSVDVGWLRCDGSPVPRSVYTALFALWGTRYGVGDGSTTFNLPDWRGRVLAGLGTHADVNALANHDGIAVNSRTPNHRHQGGAHTHDLSGHVHYAPWPIFGGLGVVEIAEPGSSFLDGVGAAGGRPGSSVSPTGASQTGTMATVSDAGGIGGIESVLQTSGGDGASSAGGVVDTTDSSGGWGVIDFWVKT